MRKPQKNLVQKIEDLERMAKGLTLLSENDSFHEIKTSCLKVWKETLNRFIEEVEPVYMYYDTLCKSIANVTLENLVEIYDSEHEIEKNAHATVKTDELMQKFEYLGKMIKGLSCLVEYERFHELETQYLNYWEIDINQFKDNAKPQYAHYDALCKHHTNTTLDNLADLYDSKHCYDNDTTPHIG